MFCKEGGGKVLGYFFGVREGYTLLSLGQPWVVIVVLDGETHLVGVGGQSGEGSNRLLGAELAAVLRFSRDKHFRLSGAPVQYTRDPQLPLLLLPQPFFEST